MDTTRRPRGISPTLFTVLAVTSFFLLVLIVLTGAAVRLTDSGLGCEDWPNCDTDTIIEAWTYHASIEFGNRLVSGFVGIVCLATAVAAWFRQPRRRDLIGWSAAIVVGVLVQAVIGRFSVTTHLHPLVVAAHFLGSPVLLWMSIVLVVRARRGPVISNVRPPRSLIVPARLVVATSALVLAVGTLVTGSGPHGGDTRADRLDLGFTAITRVHSTSAWLFLLVVITAAVSMARTPSRPERSFRYLQWLLVVTVAQGAVGYYQYLNGVPPLAVELHILGATTIWCLAVFYYLYLFDQARRPDHKADAQTGHGDLSAQRTPANAS